MSSAYVELTEADRKQLDELLSRLEIVGARYSDAQESMTNR